MAGKVCVLAVLFSMYMPNGEGKICIYEEQRVVLASVFPCLSECYCQVVVVGEQNTV